MTLAPGVSTVACGGEGGTGPAAGTGLREDLRLSRADYAVHVDASSLTLRLTRSGEELEEAASGWHHDPAARGGPLYVKVPPGDHQVTVQM